MSRVLADIITQLEEAIRAAGMADAGFGFPNDRVTIKSSHFDNQGFKTGSDVHPTEFIVATTENYRQSWIIPPIQRALAVLQANAELINRAAELAIALENLDLQRIVDLADAGKQARDKARPPF